MSKKICIIENDANILYGLQSKFAVKGFEVFIFFGNDNILELIDSIKNFLPDGVIFDLSMEYPDGFKVLSELQNDSFLNKISVFSYNTDCDQEKKERGASLGLRHFYFKKDLNIDEFVERVIRIIDRKQ